MKRTIAVLMTLTILSIYSSTLPVKAASLMQDERIVDAIGTPVHYKNLRCMLRDAGLLSEPSARAMELSSSPLPPVSGSRQLLVILVNFTDRAGAHDDVYFENRLWGPRPSLSDYYNEVSYGAFTYTQGLVLDPGRDDTAPFYYRSTFSITPAGGWTSTNTQTLARDAMTMADADIDYSLYDADGDGIVTNEELTIVIITSGVAGDYGGTAPWSHHSWADPSWLWWPATPAPVPTGDGVSVEGEYSMTSEANPIGTIAHELGHDLGLPDLYDTNGGSNGIGHYGLMGSGSWIGPAHMTAWSKIQLGWLTPTIVTQSGYFDVHDLETNAEAYILYDPDHSLTEYFLIENRWKGTSYDNENGPEGDLDDEGILIYHIDEEKGSDWWGPSHRNNVNTDEAHKMIDVECADHDSSHYVNADDLDSMANRGDSNDLWDANEYDFDDSSAPCDANWYNGQPSGVDVSELPVAGPTMRVYLSIPGTDLSVVKVVDLADAIPGDTLTYTVTVENVGTGTATAIELTDTFPDGTIETRMLNDLDPGDSTTETFSYVVPFPIADLTVLTNTATVKGEDVLGMPDVDPSNNVATASTVVHTLVLDLSKTATPSVNAGEAITYTITYENSGSGDAEGVAITDILPKDVYYSLALDQGAGPAPDLVTVNIDGTTTLTWLIGSLPSGSGVMTIEYTARPSLLLFAGESVSNDATLDFTDANGNDYPELTASATTDITSVPPGQDPRSLGFVRNHNEFWTDEILARIQATDSRFDGADGTLPDGQLSTSEVEAVMVPSGNQPKVLLMQLLTTYFNLANKQINAETLIDSPMANLLGLANVRDAVEYAMNTLKLPVNKFSRARYTNITRVLDEINNNMSEIYQ